MRPTRRRLALAAALAALGLAAATPRPEPRQGEGPHRSPIALALSADGSRLLTANQTAGTVSLVDPIAGKVLSEVATGDKPAGVAISRDGRRAVVTHWYGYDLAILDVDADQLKVVGRVEVGPEPRGVAISDDGKSAFVAVGASNEVVRVDVEGRRVVGRLGVGREPRGIAISPDGSRLLVGNARSKNLSVVNIADWKVERTLPIDGDNLRQVAVDASGKVGYVANMRNRGFATTRTNIDLGWVLGQRLTRVDLDGKDEYATLSLDPQGRAVGDVHGMGVSADGSRLAISAGGTHEVILVKTDGKRLPWREGSSRDLLPVELQSGDRYRRVDLGGRPTEVAFAPGGKTLYVANYLGDSIQVVDVEGASLARTIALGSPSTISAERLGETLFHDATRSSNQWYSCNTCHADGHTGGLDFDTLNDGWQDLSTSHFKSRKKVPTLRGVARTGPWTWHGWQTSFDDAMIESFTKSMQGPRPTGDEVKALIAYLSTLELPKNPHPSDDAAHRGEAVYRSAKAGCLSCHSGPEFTDGKVHVVGLEERQDVFEGYNPPSLRGVYDKDPYLHDGRAKTLRDALAGDHNPADLVGKGALSDAELADLIAYLKTL